MRQPTVPALFRLLVLYWRESCNIRTAAFLAVVLMITAFSQTMIWFDDTGDPQLFEPMPVSVVDLDQSLVSGIMISQLQGLDVISQVYEESREEAEARLSRYETLMLIVIPESFSRQALAGLKTDSIEIAFNTRMPAEANLVARLINHAVSTFSATQALLLAYEQELAQVLAEPAQSLRYREAAAVDMTFKMMQRENLLRVGPSVRLRNSLFVVAALATLFAMLPALLVLMLVQQERASGQHERLLIANVPWYQMHLAKILIGMIWLWAGTLPLAIFTSRLIIHFSFYILILAISLLYLVAATFCIILAYRTRRTEAAMLTAWITFLAAMLTGGAIYPIQLLPRWLRALTILSPANWSFSLMYNSLTERDFNPVLVFLFAIPLLAGGWLSWYTWRQAR